MWNIKRIPSGDIHMLHHPASPSRRACGTVGDQPQQVHQRLVRKQREGEGKAFCAPVDQLSHALLLAETSTALGALSESPLLDRSVPVVAQTRQSAPLTA